MTTAYSPFLRDGPDPHFVFLLRPVQAARKAPAKTKTKSKAAAADKEGEATATIAMPKDQSLVFIRLVATGTTLLSLLYFLHEFFLLFFCVNFFPWSGLWLLVRAKLPCHVFPLCACLAIVLMIVFVVFFLFFLTGSTHVLLIRLAFCLVCGDRTLAQSHTGLGHDQVKVLLVHPAGQTAKQPFGAKTVDSSFACVFSLIVLISWRSPRSACVLLSLNSIFL